MQSSIVHRVEDVTASDPGQALLAARQKVQALVQQGRLAEARACLPALSSLLGKTPPPAWLNDLSWRLDACWWEPVQGNSLRLRKPQGSDAAWLQGCFADAAFASAVNRDYAARIRALPVPQIAQLLEAQLKQSPVDLGAQMFIIERLTGEPLGLATFVSIDVDSRRAEYIIGFAGGVPHGTVVLETTLLLADFAFMRARFHKVTACIYSDNPRLHDLTVSMRKMGFEQEGIQRAHVRLPGGGYVDIHLMGGLRHEVLANPLMRQCAKRYLKQDWAAAPSATTHTQPG